VLLEVHLVESPQIDVASPHKLLEFFLCAA
jgi:hypothetical protein